MSYINVGKHSETKKAIRLGTKELTKHTAILGMTGSGKTGAVISMMEDMISQGIPTIAVDIKGDIINILNREPGAFEGVNVRFYTPGALHGSAVNVFDNMDNPDRVLNSVSSMLKMLKEKPDPLSAKHAFLSKILLNMYKNDSLCTLRTLIEDIQNPPFDSLGMMLLDEVMPERSRKSLASKVNNILVAPSFALWQQGVGISIDDLFSRSEKTNLTIFSVAHLTNDDQKYLALSMLLDEIVIWMKRQEGQGELKAALVIDECAGLLPPYPKNPVTKPPILTMLKQARAFGLGLILATQNPMDIDYKAMSNCETWFVGRLQMKNDRNRVLDAVSTGSAVSRNTLSDQIIRLKEREFILIRPRSWYKFITNDCKASLLGPVTPSVAKEIYNQVRFM